MTLHDVVRWLVRGGMPNTEENQRLALLAIDAHEKGFPDAETYQAELDKQRAAALAQAGPQPGESDADKAARLEARNAQLEALLAAQTASATARPEAPAPPSA